MRIDNTCVICGNTEEVEERLCSTCFENAPVGEWFPKVGDTIYTVWVGGGEITDYFLTARQATDIAREWSNQGYDDVAIAISPKIGSEKPYAGCPKEGSL